MLYLFYLTIKKNEILKYIINSYFSPFINHPNLLKWGLINSFIKNFIIRYELAILQEWILHIITSALVLLLSLKTKS